MMTSHILIKYYHFFRDRYSYLFNHFLLWNIKKWESRTWFSLSKYRYLISFWESCWKKVESVEFQLVNLPLVILCWKASVKQEATEIVERLFDYWLKMKFICIQIFFPSHFWKRMGEQDRGWWGRGSIYVNIPLLITKIYVWIQYVELGHF